MFPPGNLLKDRVRVLFVKTNISFKALSWMTVILGLPAGAEPVRKSNQLRKLKDFLLKVNLKSLTLKRVENKFRPNNSLPNHCLNASRHNRVYFAAVFV